MNSRTHAWVRSRVLLSIAAAVLVVGVGLFLRNKWAVAKTPAALVGSWVGISDGDVFTYRLELDRAGTGMFGFQFTDGTPRLYRISAWHLDGRQLEFALHPTPSSLEPVSLKGAVARTRILIWIAGVDWKNRIEMWNEGKVLPRVLSLREAMETMHNATNSVSAQR